ncbi:MAG: hypothetical protein RL351_834 [Actinomycetota bacterium]
MTKHTLRVGVIGGGQLARMMTPPAINLGLQIKVLAEAQGSSCKFKFWPRPRGHLLKWQPQWWATTTSLKWFENSLAPLM